MSRFSFRAIGIDGTIVEGTETAKTLADAHQLLHQRGLQPVEVDRKKTVFQFEITRRTVPRKEVMHFSRQLAVFVRAGIPLLDALEVISEEQDNKLFRGAIAGMIVRLEGGATFAAAAAAHPEAFPRFYISILRSAEVTGNLDTVLEQLAEYMERDLDARHKVTSALVYPAVVMAMSLVTIVVLTVYVLPKFQKFFESLNAELPLVTRALLAASHFFQNWWLVLILLGIGVFVVGALTVRTQQGRDIRDRVLLSLPGFGDVLRHAILERFCRILSAMVQAGVSLDVALSVTAEATNNVVYRNRLAEAREAMIRGEGLAEPLARTGLFPGSARQMMRVGESTGTLDQQLQIAAEYFDRELDHKIKRFTNLFEPAVIITMGVLVGFVAIAMVSAMYGIYSQVQLH
jgi:type IV pilus assembly protein PilC